jgi:hypothetical protein
MLHTCTEISHCTPQIYYYYMPTKNKKNLKTIKFSEIKLQSRWLPIVRKCAIPAYHYIVINNLQNIIMDWSPRNWLLRYYEIRTIFLKYVLNKEV